MARTARKRNQSGVIGVTADVIAGRFALCDPIGSGGSGTVWRAFDRKRHGYCAAKLLRQRDAGDLLRFVREQSVRLDHPHIVSPYSWVAEDGTVLIASDLMTGGSLHTLIGDFGPLAESNGGHRPASGALRVAGRARRRTHPPGRQTGQSAVAGHRRPASCTSCSPISG